MKVVILAGGLGTRLPEYTKNIPKPMVKINKIPILMHIMKIFIKYGHTSFYILAGYKKNIIENYYKTAILLRSNGQLPILRIKIPSYKGNILTEIFNSRKEKINDVSCIQEGDLIVGIIEYLTTCCLK